MSRSTLAVDRVVTLLLGVLLLALGVGAIVWWTGRAPVLDRLLDQVELGGVAAVTERPWWPWVLAGAGALLVLAGLRWAFAHRPGRSVDQLSLPGSQAHGRLRSDASSAVGCAAQLLRQVRGIRNARGAVVHDRGQLVARVTATIDPASDIGDVVAACDEVAVDLAQVLSRDDLSSLVLLRVAARGRRLSRVV
ncbi:MAG: hypothetical protein ACRC35_12850 [Angustibacter sp.]